MIKPQKSKISGDIKIVKFLGYQKRNAFLSMLKTRRFLNMARQDRVSLPSSQGGLMRYFDDYKSKIEIQPGVVIIMCIVIIVLVLVLQIFGKSLLG